MTAAAPLVLVLGGARSGKSEYAEARVAGIRPASVLYVATLRGTDRETAARIAAHRARRPAWWDVVEVGDDGDVAALLAACPTYDAVLCDGAELALALRPGIDDPAARLWADDLVAAVARVARRLGCIVSAEVGLGVVPATPAGVSFRDRVGLVNQVFARRASEAVLVVAGRPLPLPPG